MKSSPSSIEPLEARITPAFAAGIDLSALTDGEGFKIGGGASFNHTRVAVSGAGDVNGDGIEDFLIGTDRAVASGSEDGAAFVVFGTAGGFPHKLDLTALDGKNGFKLAPAHERSQTGVSVSGAGDVNGDGLADVIVGASRDASTGGTLNGGAAYVVFGKADGFTSELSLGALDGSNGFKFESVGGGDRTGFSVNGAGDVNGDGFADVIIGAPYANGELSSPSGGVAYVVFGRAAGFAAIFDLDSLDGGNGFALKGTSLRDYAGHSGGGAGDVNGDGFADVIVGARRADPHGSSSGAAYVVFGKASGFTAELNLSALDGSNGFKLSGEAAYNFAGYSVGGAGDMNGDGFADVVVGAPANIYLNGGTYVIYGKPGGFTADHDLSSLDGSNGFKLIGEASFKRPGVFVSGAGDVNGDGLDDLLIGTIIRGPGPAAYVVFGQAGGVVPSLELASLDGSNGFQLNTVDRGAQFEFPVSCAGDVNGDGFADLLIGAFGAIPNTDSRGAAYVVYGGDPARLQIADDGHSATYGDIDGDDITVTTSQGTFTKAMFDMRAEGVGFQLEKLDLTAPAFAGANITFNATLHNADGLPGKEGNGMVNLGYLDATGVNLGKVKLPGDLGQIDAGAVQVLNLGSLGALGTATQDPTAPSLHSDLTGNLGKLKIHGNVSGATLAVAGKIGPVKIAGDVADATITALGTLVPASALDAVAIASVSIGGHVTNSQILAGYDLSGAALNADVSIGKIIVQGNWLASSLAAGIADSTQDGFGQNDTLIPGGNDSIIAKIAGITIKGTATGSTGAGDFFGLTAERIKKAKISGVALALTPNKDDLPLDAANNDFRLVEL